MGRKRAVKMMATKEKEEKPPKPKKPAKRKKVTVKLLERKHAGKTTEAYQLMDELIQQYHAHLSDAKIAIAWRFGWNPDADGWLQLGKVKKGSDLDRAMHKFDFVIQLNFEAWNNGGLKPAEKVILMDHQFCHCQVTNDSDGKPKMDDAGRIVYRIRKHVIEEFPEIVERHGLHTHGLSELAQAGIKANKQQAEVQDNDSERPLLGQMGDGGGVDDPSNGNEATTIGLPRRRVKTTKKKTAKAAK